MINKKLLMIITLFIFIIPIVYAKIDLKNGLYAYYTFDNYNFSGNSVYDLSGNLRNAILFNVTTGQTGIVNQSFQYDGSTSYVNPPFNFKNNLNESFTITLWAKPLINTVASWLIGDNDRNFMFFSSSGQFRAVIHGATSLYTTQSYYNNKWYFFVFEYDGINGFYIIDGKNKTNWIAGSINDQLNIKIGSRGTDNTFHFNGLIDEVGFWNRTLNNTEVLKLYNNGSGLYYALFNNSYPQAKPFISPQENDIKTRVFNISWEKFTDADNDTINYNLLMNNSLLYSGLNNYFLLNSSHDINSFNSWTNTFYINWGFYNGTAYEPYHLPLDLDNDGINDSVGVCRYGFKNCTSAEDGKFLNFYLSNYGLVKSPIKDLNNNTISIASAPETLGNNNTPIGNNAEFGIFSTTGTTTNGYRINVGQLIIKAFNFPYNGNYTLKVIGSNSALSNSTILNNFYIDNEPPKLIIDTPNSYEWINNYVNGSCSDISGIKSIEINDTKFSNVNLSFPNFQFNYIGNISIENVSVKINCTDNLNFTSFTERPFNIDMSIPYCANLENVTLPYNSTYNWNNHCFDDLNFYSLNVSCFGGSNFSFYQENLNTTDYLFTASTGFMTANSQCNFISFDAHTKKDIRKKLNKNRIFKNRGKINIKNGKNNFTIIESQQIVNNIVFDYSKKDRVRFTYEMNKKNRNKNIKEKKTFFVNANKKAYYYKSNKYKAWIVVDNKYWIDFNLRNDKNANYFVKKINSKRYQIDIMTSVENLEFESIGLLNSNNQSQIFTITPLSIGGGTGSVNVSTTIIINGQITKEDYNFTLLILLFVALIWLCLYSTRGNIMHIFTAIYGIYLTFFSINNNIISGFLNFIFAIIGILMLFYGMKLNEKNK